MYSVQHVTQLMCEDVHSVIVLLCGDLHLVVLVIGGVQLVILVGIAGDPTATIFLLVVWSSYHCHHIHNHQPFCISTQHNITVKDSEFTLTDVL